MCGIVLRDLKITIEANKKSIDYLDVNLNLTTGKHQPYIKPGNRPLYINTKSNHPPSIFKAVPEGINNRLSLLSSDETIFKEAIPIYQQALNNSGFKHELKYKPSVNNKKQQKRKRKRNIIWYNPPFDMQVRTKIGSKFIKIIEDSFPDDHILKPIFNRNTVKLSYSCMPNIKNKIDQHNKSQLKPKENNSNTCNCRNKTACPLEGKCLQSSIIYQATVTANQPSNNSAAIETKETYIGLTETTFKLRHGNHKHSFNNPKLRNATELSKHIWTLKEKQIDYTITWKIISKAKAYSNSSKICHLCLQEKYYIICHPEIASLNQKSGLLNSCRHKNKFLLSNHPT